MVPKIKLPVFYLLDSILKNCGGVYLKEFAKLILSIFKNTYEKLPKEEKGKLEKVLETWKQPPGRAEPLFALSLLDELDKYIRGQKQLQAAPKFTVRTFFKKKHSFTPILLS